MSSYSTSCHVINVCYNIIMCYMILCFNSLRPRRNRRHFADAIFKCIFLNENVWIVLKISLKFVPKVRINNIPALVQMMAWRRPGDKPLSEQWWSVYWRIYASLSLNELTGPACNMKLLYILGHVIILWILSRKIKPVLPEFLMIMSLTLVDRNVLVNKHWFK